MKIFKKTYFRFNEWKGNNYNILICYFYIWNLIYGSTFEVFTKNLLFILPVIYLLGSLGYYFNDLCDVKPDKLANKPNTVENHSIVKRVIILLCLIMAPLIIWWFSSFSKIILILIFIEFIAIFTYSSPWVRFKEHPILSIINDTLFAQVIFSLIIISVISPTIYTDYLLIVILFLSWIIIQGAKWITSHHLKDAENDKISSTHTTVTKYGFQNMMIANKLFMPLIEIVLFSSLLILISPILTFTFVVYIIFKSFEIKSNLSSFLKWEYKPMQDIGYVILNLFYIRYLPILVLIILSFESFLYLYVLLFHLLFFYKNTIYLYQETFGKISIKYRIISWSKLLFNHSIYYSFLIIGINLKEFHEYSFWERLILIKNSKRRRAIIYSLPQWSLDFEEEINTIRNEWISFTERFIPVQQMDGISVEQKESNKKQERISLILLKYNHLNNPEIKSFPTVERLLQKHKKNIVYAAFSNIESVKGNSSLIIDNPGISSFQIEIDLEEPENKILQTSEKNNPIKEKRIYNTKYQNAFENEHALDKIFLVIYFYKPMPIIYHWINKYNIHKRRENSYIKTTPKNEIIVEDSL